MSVIHYTSPTLPDTLFLSVRKKQPLVHCMTNFVTMNFCANSLLAVGASPVMAQSSAEVEDVVAASQCLAINIGTLDPQWIEAAVSAALVAQKNNIPVVLDPVGAGFTRLRTNAAFKILATGAVSVLRGNASEIAALAGDAGSKKGVDSNRESITVRDQAAALSHSHKCVVCVSGAVDLVVLKHQKKTHQVAEVHDGNAAMTKVTGTGCVATVLISAALGAGADAFMSSYEAMTLLGRAGTRAAEKSSGPGSLAISLIDELENLSSSRATNRR